MKMIATAAILAMVVVPAAAQSPVQKVLELLAGLQEKITAEGTEATATFEEFTAFCKDRTKELKFEIKTGKGEIEGLQAVIDEETANIAALAAKVDELTASIATNEAELKKATELRATEASDFAAAEKELTETIDMIERASHIIEREMSKGASMVQLGGAEGLTAALSAVVQATSVDSADKAQLAALLQQHDSDEGAGAPDAAVYESHSGNLAAALDNLLEKAQEQLADARQAETEALHAFEMKKQGLEDEIKFANKDLAAAQKSSSAASEKKSIAEGDLTATSKDLAADEKGLEDLQHECMEKAEAYETEKASREAELKALAEASKVISEATGGAEKLAYGLAQAPALLQVKEESSGVQAMNMVRRLAFAQHSSMLAQLASRMEHAIHTSADPFAKVKGLLADMLDKLEAEMSADATQKAFCDKEIAQSTSEKDEATAELDKLTTKLEQATAASAKLKEELSVLAKELSQLAATQAEMDKLRNEESTTFAKNKPEMEQGIEGVKLALKTLEEYYASEADHDSAEGAGAGIISLLEVCESDFSKLLATMVAEEERAAAEYESQTQENEITKTTKEQDVTYKTKERAALEKAATELKADSATVQEQLDAVDKYHASLEKQCTAKVETYEERVAARNAEIAGLKEALEILSSEESPALVQRATVHRNAALRGPVALHRE